MEEVASDSFDIVIQKGKTEQNYWKDLWRYRELFYILGWRDIKVRYKQTVIGSLWVLVRPLLTMLVFSFVFGRIAKLPTDGSTPYSLFIFAGLLPWQFFSTSLAEASNSLIGNTNLITKVYFPRLIIPASSLIASLVDFAICFMTMIVMMFLFQQTPTINVLAVPVFVMLTIMTSFGIGILLTGLNVRYRDFRYIVPFIVQLGLYISPVGYSSGIIPEKWRLLFSLNPMVGIIDGFRWSLFGKGSFPVQSVSISFLVALIFLFIGIRYFRRTEKAFADHI